MSRQIEIDFFQSENNNKSSTVANDLFSANKPLEMNMDREELSPTVKVTAHDYDEKNDIFSG